MRQIALDTETTGFKHDGGDRIVEIGCVELVAGMRTGSVYHIYINPQRAVGEGAERVHGLSTEFLRKHAPFEKISAAFLEFIGEDELIIHNADFDMGFLNAELARMKLPPLKNKVIDSLILARKKFPRQRNRLDDLCRRFGIDLSGRAKHGALLDAGLLADVYIGLTSGSQASFLLAKEEGKGGEAKAVGAPAVPAPAEPMTPASPATPKKAHHPAVTAANRLTPEEEAAHKVLVAQLKSPLWREFQV